LRSYYDVVVVGGGIVGVFATLDLALRGVSVLLIERRKICSGASGRSHGMLHSGARYATTDPKAAEECIKENRILSEIAPHCIRDVGGVFVSVNAEEEEYHSQLADSCHRAGIPVKDIDIELLRALEPNISPHARTALLVPDKIVYARDLALSALLKAVASGASALEGASVERVLIEKGEVVGVEAASMEGVYKIGCRGVVNAAGPWCSEVARRAGLSVEVIPAAGVMGVASANLTRHIVNRMRPPSDGDIIVPYTAGATIAGTTARIAEDLDRIEIGGEDEEILLQECGEAIPALRAIGFSRLYASVRPLIAGEAGLRETTRSFEIIDHYEDDVRGFVTAVGGKLTTGRLIAENAANAIARHIGAPQGVYTEKLRLEQATREEVKQVIEALRQGEVTSPLESLISEALEAIDNERYLSLLLPIIYSRRAAGGRS